MGQGDCQTERISKRKNLGSREQSTREKKREKPASHQTDTERTEK